MDHTKKIAKNLGVWFKDFKRDLPWRRTQDPYKIWISEVMLQQTTTTAVIPFYEKFTRHFKTLDDLANAPLEEVYEYWAGLGYYSRARNLHKSAKEIQNKGSFPNTFEQLIELPGFGPYTARSVASIAFGQSVGVLDGNVIRILARIFDKPVDWWKTTARNELQQLADQIASHGSSSELNQAMMELGATVCTPIAPKCILCPLLKQCELSSASDYSNHPPKKPKKAKVLLHWNVYVPRKKGQLGVLTNDYAPFMKGKSIFPGTIETLKEKPKNYLFKHNITHYEIYVSQAEKSSQSENQSLKNLTWISESDISKKLPYNLIKKVIQST